MEDRKLSEKESLDIITQMINSSKRNMKVGSGNVLLYWGYFTVLLSVVISSLILCTQNYIWSWGWMLMFAVGPVISYKQRGCEPAVVTYTDKTISKVWQVFDRGILCALWAIRQFYIDASFIVIILWIRGIYKWHYLAGEMDDLLSGGCFRFSYPHADEFDKS